MDILNNIISGLPNTILIGIFLYLYTRYEKERSKRIENIENQLGNHFQTQMDRIESKVDSNYKEQQKVNIEILKELSEIKGYLKGYLKGNDEKTTKKQTKK